MAILYKKLKQNAALRYLVEINICVSLSKNIFLTEIMFFQGKVGNICLEENNVSFAKIVV